MLARTSTFSEEVFARTFDYNQHHKIQLILRKRAEKIFAVKHPDGILLKF